MWRAWRVPDFRVERWRALGRFLPREVRERIFDPAFSDLTYAWLTAAEKRRRVPFALNAMATYLGCFPIAIPRLFLHGGRLTRLGRYSLWAVGVLVALVLVVANVIQAYASYGP